MLTTITRILYRVKEFNIVLCTNKEETLNGIKKWHKFLKFDIKITCIYNEVVFNSAKHARPRYCN